MSDDADEFAREQRFTRLVELLEAVAEGKPHDTHALRLVAGSILAAWMSTGFRPRIEQFLEVAAPPRSKSTPQRLYRKILRERSGSRKRPSRKLQQSYGHHIASVEESEE